MKVKEKFLYIAVVFLSLVTIAAALWYRDIRRQKNILTTPTTFLDSEPKAQKGKVSVRRP